MNEELKSILNKYGSLNEPFLFIISYDLSKYFVKPLSELSDDIKYEIKDKVSSKISKKQKIEKYPISYEEYKKEV